MLYYHGPMIYYHDPMLHYHDPMLCYHGPMLYHHGPMLNIMVLCNIIMALCSPLNAESRSCDLCTQITRFAEADNLHNLLIISSERGGGKYRFSLRGGHNNISMPPNITNF